MSGIDDSVSEDALQRLKREQVYLDRARTYFKQSGDEAQIQLCFAENQDEDDLIGVIRQFVALIEKGITPPPHILQALFKHFRKYLDGSGSFSLDEAFGLKPKQRVGHPLKHRADRENRGKIIYLMFCLRRDAQLRGEVLSIEGAASEVINQFDLLCQEDSLKKDYINLKSDEIFGSFIDVLNEYFPAEKK